MLIFAIWSQAARLDIGAQRSELTYEGPYSRTGFFAPDQHFWKYSRVS
jgi:hypothetical protein